MDFVLLMGAPGAGKGTQAKRLQEALGLPHVATGDLFRDNLARQTELGKLAQTYMNAGKLVPDEITVAMAKERLSQPDCESGALLDGFPRTLAQAEAFDKLVEELSANISIVPYIHVSEEEVIARLLGRAEKEGRSDDNAETIQVRMRVYDELTAPLLNYYEEKGLLMRVNGEQSVDQVFEELVAIISAVS